jgi:DNA-binding XRE family transcriptional regulator
VEPRKRKHLFEDQAAVHTVAQLKGRRLRMARALTGFSRQELYDKIGIATSTIDTWESGRVELTEKSAVRICDAFKHVGIYCTGEWLLTGNGDPPRLMKDVEKSIFMFNDVEFESEKSAAKLNVLKIHPFLDEDIRKELSFFISFHKNVLFHVLEEDFMNFRYRKSDCVAGKIDDPKNLEGCVVIAQPEDGKTLLCKLIRCLGEECEIIFGKHDPVKNLKIVKVAEILWHRTSGKSKGKR